jgi:hypothetical protein
VNFGSFSPPNGPTTPGVGMIRSGEDRRRLSRRRRIRDASPLHLAQRCRTCCGVRQALRMCSTPTAARQARQRSWNGGSATAQPRRTSRRCGVRVPALMVSLTGPISMYVSCLCSRRPRRRSALNLAWRSWPATASTRRGTVAITAGQCRPPTTSTGHEAVRITRSATLPISSRCTPVRP